jgi:hypothetical protein
LRVVEVSACSKAWNSRPSCRGDADAGIRDLEAHQQFIARLFQQPARRTMALLGELDGVAGIVEQRLAQARRVAAQPRRHGIQSTSICSPLVLCRFADEGATCRVRERLESRLHSSCSRPASILDRSRMSLMMASRWRGGVDLVQPLACSGVAPVAAGGG